MSGYGISGAIIYMNYCLNWQHKPDILPDVRSHLKTRLLGGAVVEGLGDEGVNAPLLVVTHLLPVVDDEYTHLRVVLQPRQQLRRQEEVLKGVNDGLLITKFFNKHF